MFDTYDFPKSEVLRKLKQKFETDKEELKQKVLLKTQKMGIEKYKEMREKERNKLFEKPMLPPIALSDTAINTIGRW